MAFSITRESAYVDVVSKESPQWIANDNLLAWLKDFKWLFESKICLSAIYRCYQQLVLFLVSNGFSAYHPIPPTLVFNLHFHPVTKDHIIG
ncbi:hypothetical protein FACS1894179_00680 [Bacteroidia bacterium]|nr:hypothetical protein FACS1894169_07090 [Bacteroidia bacterium]GHV38039.1 hypothetical protein FACS1894179_00680 [Bacteroidia bacterium]